ncbi:MAG: hypothetical protein ABR560_10065, partial [Bacteroidales bacterium]
MTADLIIAGRMIRLRSDDGITLRPDERFMAFMTVSRPAVDGGGATAATGGAELTVDAEADLRQAFSATQGPERQPELTVDVFPGKAELPADAKKVFDARLMEETPDGMRDTGEPFWEILTGKDITYAKVYLKDPVRNPVLVMPHGKMAWQIFADGQGPDVEPLPYPLDGQGPVVNPLPYPLDGQGPVV